MQAWDTDIGLKLLLFLLLLFAPPPSVKGKRIGSNFQIIELLVPPRAAGVTETLISVWAIVY